MKWYERPEILSYIVDCYAGTDKVGGRTKRQFLWEEKEGDLVIGNSRAFADHVAERFSLQVSDKAWMDVHEALRAMGEIVQVHITRNKGRGQRFRNQEPESHVIRPAPSGRRQEEER